MRDYRNAQGGGSVLRAYSSKVGWFDFFLAYLGGALALWSSGNAIGRVDYANIFLILYTVGMAVGFVLSQILPDNFSRNWNAIIYTVACVACIFFVRDLNDLLPDRGFPVQLLMAGAFSWMVTLGGFLAWRDSVLCFQAVPCIAIFGLVGAYDTYQPAPFLFFGLIITVASLFFRTHARAMLRQTSQSLETSSEGDLTDEAMVERVVASGAWRWMAGPEWALASALIIIVASIFGAPAIQQSVQGVTNAVRVNLPNPAASNQSGNATQNDIRVGTGPSFTRDTLVLEAKGDNLEYLRSRSFGLFTGSGWINEFPRRLTVGRDPERVIPMGVEKPVALRYRSGWHSVVYSPGEFERWGATTDIVETTMAADGAVTLMRQSYPGLHLEFVARVADPSITPVEVATVPYSPTPGIYVSQARLSEEVRTWALSNTRNVVGDYNKLLTLERLIGQSCNYNLRAKAIPTSKNAVDTFLFENREGYCDLFATAMAMTARALQLPSRVSIGYAIDSERKKDGWYQIKEKDYHMWAEVYFADVGWVAFDPTRYSKDVTPKGDPDDPNEIRRIFMLAGAIGLSALVLALVSIKKILAWLRVALAPRTPRSELDKVFLGFQSFLESRYRKPRRFHETGIEYLDRVLPPGLAGGHEIRKLFSDFELAMYSPEEIAKVQVAEFKSRVNQIRSLVNSK
ncbi:MAG: transglutaminase family protein [Armatimonadetes bacterium]|nr:transglutaminase family protein [Armatimonadota bacterium]